MSTIKQYVLVRGDLMRHLNWPVGAVIAQACHASIACLHLFREDEQTKKYLADLDNMNKVVLEVPTEGSLNELSEELQRNNILHKLWMEQPENMPTCIALKPYTREEVNKYITKYKLYSLRIPQSQIAKH